MLGVSDSFKHCNDELLSGQSGGINTPYNKHKRRVLQGVIELKGKKEDIP